MDTVVKTDTVTVTINGKQIECEKGARLLDVCLQNNVFVPHLCYYERLSPYAGCRTCVVEIEGVRGTPVSCTATVADGMVVRTNTSQLEEIRRGVMEYILCDHPGRCFDCHRLEHCGPGLICLRDEVVTERCLTCAKNRFCELQEVSEHINMRGRNLYYTEKQQWYGETNQREVVRIIRTNPFIELEFDKCIVCTRCVRVCDEVRGRGVFTLSYKGPQAKIDTMFGVPLQDTDCEFCGACVDVCPTAAIMDKTSKWVGIPDQTIETTCHMCSVGCGLKLAVKKGKLVQGFPDFDNPANKGQICALGRYGHDYVQAATRLTTPLIRRNGELQPASWDEAIALIVEKFANSKGDAFGLIASARQTNEDLYVAQKFARAAMESNNIDHGSSVIARQTLAAIGARLGHTAAASNTWDDLSEAGAILLLDADITQSHPIAGVEVLEGVRRKTTRLVVAATEEPEIVRLVAGNCLFLKHAGGSEAFLLAGILKAMQDENLFRSGADTTALASVLATVDLDVASAMTGVPADDMRQAARILAGAASTAVVFPAELPWLAGSEAAVDAAIDLALVTNTLGVAGGGLYALLPQGNSQGAFDMGAVPDMLPAHKPTSRGKTVAEMMDSALAGDLKTLYIVGENPAAGANASLVREVIAKADFVVVQDVTLTETAALADVVLPGAAIEEKTGSLTNNERRIQRVQAAVPFPGEAQADWQVLSVIARKLGASGFGWESAGEVLDEIASHVPIYAGVSSTRLEEGPLTWPVALESAAGIDLLYGSGFQGDFGKTGGFRLGGPHASGTLALQSLYPNAAHGRLEKATPGQVVSSEIVELHADDAARFGVADGDTVTLNGAEGSVAAKARISNRATRGTARVSFLFSETDKALSNSAGRISLSR